MIKNVIPVNILLFAAFCFLNCSLITDFDSALLESEDAGELYSLDANIDDPVDVILYDNGTASIALELDEPLPDVDDEILLSMIDVGIIRLTVLNEDTDVSTHLAEGTRVEDGSSPNSAGEYALYLNETRDELGVLFWNETESGQALQVDDNYRAIIDVTPNRIFVAELFTRDVVISESE
jgi:hypothetical protein